MATKANQNQTGDQGSPTASEHGDLGAAELQERFDQANAKGYFGHVADPTPNHAYTFAGQAEGAATPETDPALKAEADKLAKDPTAGATEEGK